MDTQTVRWMVLSALFTNFLCDTRFFHDNKHGWKQTYIENLRKRFIGFHGNETTMVHKYWWNNTKAQSRTLASLIRHQESMSEKPSLTRSFVIGK